MSYSSLNEHERQFVKLMNANAGRYRTFEIFRDFVTMAACTLSNQADRLHYEEREAMYMEVAKKYDATELRRFAEMFACIVESLELEMHDSLGLIFMHEDFGSDWHGQFFTPYCLSSMMARFTLQDARERIARRGFIRISEPASGSGSMIIAAANYLHDEGINYQKSMHVVATDLDIVVVHMAYIQFSLLYIPAIVIHGNSLTRKTMSHWATLAHVADDWDRKLTQQANMEALLNLMRGNTAPVAPTPAKTVDIPRVVSPVVPAVEKSAVPDLAALGVTIATQRAQQMTLF